MLEIINYSKTYPGGKKAVSNLNLKVDAGDIYGFIGHNGAGKSTTIKSAVGILDFDEGQILIDGHSIIKEPVLCKSMIAYIPDNPDIYGHLSGVQYLNFICNIFGVPADEKNEKIEKYSTMFGMKENLADPISTYSHGMRQKIAIIAAISHSPKLLILDEPFVGLDPIASYQLKEIFKEMCKNGSAIFFSTHVLEVVEKLCNKVAIIKDGVLIKSGNTDEVRGDETLEEIFISLSESKDA